MSFLVILQMNRGFNFRADGLRHPVAEIVAVVALMPVAFEARTDPGNETRVKFETLELAFNLAEHCQIVQRSAVSGSRMRRCALSENQKAGQSVTHKLDDQIVTCA